MPENIFVLVDHNQGNIRTGSLEALAMAQQLARESGGGVHAVLLGSKPAGPADQLLSYEIERILLVQDPQLEAYDPDLYCAALRQIVEAEAPSMILMTHSYQNIDLAPKLAAVLKRALLTDCIGYRFENGQPTFVRQMFRGKLNADMRIHSPRPWLISIQQGSFRREALISGTTTVSSFHVDLSGVDRRRLPIEEIEVAKNRVDLTNARVVVGVGRGIRSQENMKLIEELASVLGAEIGASRPIVDSGWLERERQIGSSGQTVAPKLYIACGISGAIQHLVGMKNSGCIVAINTDPNAPIFNVATYGIVGDLAEVLPNLISKLKDL